MTLNETHIGDKKMNFFNTHKDLEPLLKQLEQRCGIKNNIGKYKSYWKVPYFSFIQHRMDAIERGHFARKTVQFSLNCLNGVYTKIGDNYETRTR
jgi:hypothetical protein